jgi:predicted heme/steroid binding protein
MIRRFTRRELRAFNGEGGAPAYLACYGLVYDASHSFQWQKGAHQVVHRAGEDLTGALALAPHGIDLLAGLPIVGVLVDEDESSAGARSVDSDLKN